MRCVLIGLAFVLTGCATADPYSIWCTSGCINNGLGRNDWYRSEDWGGKKPAVKKTVKRCHVDFGNTVCEETSE